MVVDHMLNNLCVVNLTWWLVSGGLKMLLAACHTAGERQVVVLISQTASSEPNVAD